MRRYEVVPLSKLRRQMRIRRMVIKIATTMIFLVIAAVLAILAILAITEPYEAIAETLEAPIGEIHYAAGPENVTEPEIGPEDSREYIGTFKLTAYCSCRKCCGKWSGGPTASGAMPQAGRTIAVDKRVIPLGTKVYIEGYGEFIAEDTGVAIKGNRIDIYMDSHEAARHFADGAGSCQRRVWLIKTF